MKQKRNISLIYFVSFISLGLITGMTGPSLPSFAENTGTSLSQLSALFIFGSLGFIVGSYIAGRLLEKFDGHRLLAIVLVLLAIGVASLPLIRSLWVLVGILFLLGIVQSHLDVCENTLLIWLHGDKVAPFMNGLHFFFGLGSFLAPLLIAQSIRLTSTINLAFYIMAAVMLLPVIFLLRYEAPTLASAAESNSKKKTKTPVILIVFLLLFFFGYAGAEITFGNWIYTYSIKQGFTTAEQAAYLTSLFWGIFTLFRLAGIFISRKLSINTILTINISGGLLTLVSLIVFSQSAVVLWVGTALHGLFIASTFPTAMNLTEKIGAVSSRITSFIFIACSLAGMISPWFAGQWIESSTPIVTIWVVLANFSLVALMFIAIRWYLGARERKEAIN